MTETTPQAPYEFGAPDKLRQSLRGAAKSYARTGDEQQMDFATELAFQRGQAAALMARDRKTVVMNGLTWLTVMSAGVFIGSIFTQTHGLATIAKVAGSLALVLIVSMLIWTTIEGRRLKRRSAQLRARFDAEVSSL